MHTHSKARHHVQREGQELGPGQPWLVRPGNEGLQGARNQVHQHELAAPELHATAAIGVQHTLLCRLLGNGR